LYGGGEGNFLLVGEEYFEGEEYFVEVRGYFIGGLLVGVEDPLVEV